MRVYSGSLLWKSGNGSKGGIIWRVMAEEVKQFKAPIEGYEARERGWRFGEIIWRRGFWPAVHLGEDLLAEAGEEVRSVADGEAVFSKILPGSASHQSWGGLVVLRHDKSKTLFTLYGHLRNLEVKVGDSIMAGQKLGEVAEGLTAENGWWKKTHLHFGLYGGPWQGKVLPGWWQLERFWRTRLTRWRDPARVLKS